jgi:hypothetical protein
MNDFDTLHAALRADIETLRTDIERRFTQLESKIDQKPNTTTIFLAMLITMVLTIGIFGAAAVLVIRETFSFEVEAGGFTGPVTPGFLRASEVDEIDDRRRGRHGVGATFDRASWPGWPAAAYRRR